MPVKRKDSYGSSDSSSEEDLKKTQGNKQKITRKRTDSYGSLSDSAEEKLQIPVKKILVKRHDSYGSSDSSSEEKPLPKKILKKKKPVKASNSSSKQDTQV